MSFGKWVFLILFAQYYNFGQLLDFTETAAPMNCSILQQAEIIVALHDYFHSGIVFLLQDEEHLHSRNGKKTTAYITKYLASRNIPTIALSTKSPHVSTQLSFCNPLRVILSTDSYLYTLFDDYHLKGIIWLSFFKEGQTSEEMLKKTYIRFDVLFLIAKCNDRGIKLYEVYHVTHGSTLQVLEFGDYIDRHINSYGNSYIYMRRHSLQGHVIKVASMDEYPVVMAPGANKIDGFYGAVWSILEKSLNFRSEVIVPEDNLWGAFINGSWNGVMGILDRNEAEIGVCGVVMNAQRAKVISYTLPLIMFHDKLYINEHDMVSHHTSNNFFRTFSPGIWITIVIFVFIITLTFKIFHHLGCLRHSVDSIEFTFYNAILCVWTALCQQGQTNIHVTATCRIVLISSYLLAVVLVCAYSATVTSFLTVQDFEPPFTNLEQLNDNPYFRLGIIKGSGKFTKFKTAKTGILKELYRNKIKSEGVNLPIDAHDGLNKVCSIPKYSFSAPIEKSSMFFNQLPCQIAVIPHDVAILPLSISFTKNSSFFPIIQYNLQRMKEAGILHKLKRQIFPPQRPIVNSIDAMKSVNFHDSLPIFSVLVSGIAMSLFIISLENMCNVIKMQKKQHLPSPNSKLFSFAECSFRKLRSSGSNTNRSRWLPWKHHKS